MTRKAEWLTQLQQHHDQLTRLTLNREAAGTRREQMRHDWEALLCPLGITSLSPSELRAWLTLRDKLIDQLHQLRDRRTEESRFSCLIDDHRHRLFNCLAAIALPTPDGGETLAALIEHAGALITAHDARAKKRDRLEAERDKESSSQAAVALRLSEIEAELESWRGPWAEKMARIGLGPDATPEQASMFLDQIARLFQDLEKAKGFQSRIRGIDRDAAAFAAEVRALVTRVAPGLAAEAPAAAAEKLYASLRAAREDAQKYRSLTEQIETETRKLVAADKDHGAANLELDTLCRDARCPSADDLPAAEERSARRRQLEADLIRCEGQIREHSAGASVEAFAEEVAQLNPDGLNLMIEELGKDLTEIQQRLDQINQTIGAERTQLAQMDGSSKAALASETAGFALAQLQEDVPRYVALRLAATILQQGIERYRERNQGPVLARASEIFASLTMNSFEGLRIEPDNDGEAVIVGVRRADARLWVSRP